jgi:ferredoxin
MSASDRTLHLCNCNATLPLDGAAIAHALELAGELPVGTQLCQKELAAFADRATGDMVVACTQEAHLFGEVAEESARAQTIRFVNIREQAGWSREGRAATPKIAALLAAAALPDPPPVPTVAFRSEGQLAIIGAAAPALAWAGRLHEQLGVTVLVDDDGADHATELPIARAFPVYSGGSIKGRGWLGTFELEWEQSNPIDLDRCTRCNACIRACPEHAIGFDYQVDLDRCRDHRQCVSACGEIGAIDFDRRDRHRHERFDLVLDLRARPLFAMHQPPQGYWHPGADPAAQAAAVAEIALAVGDFEKPKFFEYKASICAHSRSRKVGCTQCIDVCSAAAIAPDGDHIRVEPHLCVGCGACTTVCPSGALAYAYPPVPSLGERIRTLLTTYARAGGRDACLLLHDEAGRALIETLGRRGPGLPARVIPVELHHMAATGLDVWLAALAHGACQVAVLATDAHAPQYAAALEREAALADVIVQALGYQGTHVRPIRVNDARALEPALWSLQPALGVRVPATFAWTADKRTTAALAIEHLLLHAPVPRTEVPLPAGAPYGAILVDRDRCTLCLACVGACPEGAILDHPQAEVPQLRFIESKCVQCGLCVATCPEDAIRLQPRLVLTAEARQPKVMNEASMFHCTRCGKPLGTDKMIATMLGKLAGHSMFAQPGALERLKMCADCRVIDKMQADLGGPRPAP